MRLSAYHTKLHIFIYLHNQEIDKHNRFYGGSDSLKTRLSTTVCQKIDGYNYITEVI